MKNNYKADLSGLCQNPAFTEASAEEMRVLLTLASLDGAPTEESDISRMAGVSAARCRAAIAFWEGAGVLSVNRTPGIVEEFEERLVAGELDEEPIIEVAETIRDEQLASLIDECTALVGTPCLPPRDVNNIVYLVSQYGLTPEYIITLAAYMASKGELKIKRLCDKAIELQRKDIESVEALERFIDQKEKGYEYEYRRIMGIYNRALSKDESECFRKWSCDFGYSAEIISEAYNIAVKYADVGKSYHTYMDSVLTNWYNAGCKTLNECLAHSESEKAKSKAQQTEKKYTKSKPEAPRYGNFDVNEAFLNAVERSFGEKDED